MEIVIKLARLHHHLTSRSSAIHSISKYSSIKLTHEETQQVIDIYLDLFFPSDIIDATYFYDGTKVLYVPYGSPIYVQIVL